MPAPRDSTGSHVAVIDGQRVRVYERRKPIPDTLERLLEGGRDRAGRPWRPLRVVVRDPMPILRGARPECSQQVHRLVRWVEGFHTGSDGIARYLHLQACLDCGAVCVRDRSIDTLDRLPAGRQPLRRRDHVLGWYTGARPGQRQYT